MSDRILSANLNISAKAEIDCRALSVSEQLRKLFEHHGARGMGAAAPKPVTQLDEGFARWPPSWRCSSSRRPARI